MLVTATNAAVTVDGHQVRGMNVKISEGSTCEVMFVSGTITIIPEATHDVMYSAPRPAPMNKTLWDYHWPRNTRVRHQYRTTPRLTRRQHDSRSGLKGKTIRRRMGLK